MAGWLILAAVVLVAVLTPATLLWLQHQGDQPGSRWSDLEDYGPWFRDVWHPSGWRRPRARREQVR